MNATECNDSFHYFVLFKSCDFSLKSSRDDCKDQNCSDGGLHCCLKIKGTDECERSYLVQLGQIDCDISSNVVICILLYEAVVCYELCQQPASNHLESTAV